MMAAGPALSQGDAGQHKNSGADHGPDADHGGIKKAQSPGQGDFALSFVV